MHGYLHTTGYQNLTVPPLPAINCQNFSSFSWGPLCLSHILAEILTCLILHRSYSDNCSFCEFMNAIVIYVMAKHTVSFYSYEKFGFYSSVLV